VSEHRLRVRRLGCRPYEETLEEMRQFTLERRPGTPCELWLLEHPPVFTFGQGGRPEHLHDPGDIPVVRSDRGGQITYHGPGQMVAYTLFDLNRLGIGIRTLVNSLEQAVIDVLAASGVEAQRRPRAPGVYAGGAKIASVGLRVKRGRSYHGLSFNVDMDLAPFGRIDPCGYRGLAVTRCKDLGLDLDVARAGTAFTRTLCELLGYRPEISGER
jgi:lipoyl(octanoyl) transferase